MLLNLRDYIYAEPPEVCTSVICVRGCLPPHGFEW